MSFLSVTFAVFVAAGLLALHFAPARARPALLLALSIAFYCTWNPWHTLLLLGTTALAHRCALLIQRTSVANARLRFATLAVALLVIVLVVFKCALSVVGETSDTLLWLVAPLGLSYYLFKLIGYLLDVYWEKLPARPDLVSVALYAAFFPQIVSGPIQRAGDFFQQLEQSAAPDLPQSVVGLRRILFGLFKKLVVADQLAVIVADAHARAHDHSSLELLLGAYCFSLQMYADFSGVTDIAIGVGQLFGIRGPENFDRPYFARNLQEFWRRWHMSLTSWLTDYLFVPLRMAMRRLGNTGLALAIFINMVAVGVWHGPRWTYLVFGCLNGAMMIVSALTLKRRNAFFRGHPVLERLRPVGATLVTFHLVVATHVFFQAADLGSALHYLAGIFHLGQGASTVAPLRLDLRSFGLSPARLALAVFGLAAAECVHWFAKRPAVTARFASTRRPLRWALYYGAAVLVIMSAKGTTSFIYARF